MPSVPGHAQSLFPTTISFISKSAFSQVNGTSFLAPGTKKLPTPALDRLFKRNLEVCQVQDRAAFVPIEQMMLFLQERRMRDKTVIV